MTECPVCKCYDCDEIEHHSLVVDLRAEVERLTEELEDAKFDIRWIRAAYKKLVIERGLINEPSP